MLEGSLGIEPSFAEGVMCPLPDGAVDIAAIMRWLRTQSFAGPVVVEQDLNETAAETPAELVRRNFDYISQFT